MPLYLQVAKLMRRKVETQQWRFGQQIPTLDELEKEYQVSRITLRASLDQLEEEGIVKRTRGSGTFVAKDLSHERWFKLPGNFSELVATVAELESQLLVIDQEDHPLQPEFEFGQVAPAYRRLRRVHYYNGVPYCAIEIYLEKEVYLLCPAAFDNAPVVPTLASLPNIEITAGKQIMRISISDEETAGHLNIGIGDPVADVCRSLLDKSGRVVYYAHIQYPARTIQIETDLFASAPISGTKNARAKRGKKNQGT